MNVVYIKLSKAHLVVTLRVFDSVSEQTLLTQLRHGDSTCRFKCTFSLSRFFLGLPSKTVTISATVMGR